jgi:hypothetical protein
VTQTLVRDTPSQHEKLRKIYEFVRDNIRYIAIDIGLGGYQPHHAESVLRNSYGDCKDMTALIIAMGHVVGIDIDPALIATWFHGTADSGLVSQAHFNHVIAHAVLDDGSEIWMDATDKKCPFGSLPWYDQDRSALIASRETETLQRTPAEPPSSNRSDRNWMIRIDDGGMAEGDLRVSLHGAQAMEFRRQIDAIHPTNIYTWVSQELFTHYPMTLGESLAISNRSELHEPIEITGTFTSPHIVLKSQDLYTFFPDAISTFDWHRLFPSTKRLSDIVLRHPLTMTDNVELQVPASWKCISETLGDTLSSEFGEYRWKLEIFSKGRASFSRHYTWRATHIPKMKYTEFRKFLLDIALSDQTLILFTKP